MGTIALAHFGRDTGKTGGATDSDLVAAVRRGDDTAFEELYRRYRERITAYAARVVGGREHAEEIAQDAFVSALRRLRETEQAIAFKAWIYGIARNRAIDYLRARSRRPGEVDYDSIEGFAEISCAPCVPAPETAMESKQALADLRGAFGGLSETHHRILVLRELEGLTYEQIAARLGMSRSQVESTLFRARRRLEEEYCELVSGQRCQQVQAILARVGADGAGVRDSQRIQRHLSHCPACRREARRAAPLALV